MMKPRWLVVARFEGQQEIVGQFFFHWHACREMRYANRVEDDPGVIYTIERVMPVCSTAQAYDYE